MKLIVQMHACQFGRLGQACEGRAKRRIFAIGNSTGLSFPTCQPTRGCYVTCGKHYTPLLSQTLHSALPPSVLLALAHEQQLLRDLATAERLTLPAAKLLLIHSFPIPPLTIETLKVVSLGKNRDEVRPLAQSISTNVVVLQSQTVFSGNTGFLSHSQVGKQVGKPFSSRFGWLAQSIVQESNPDVKYRYAYGKGMRFRTQSNSQHQPGELVSSYAFPGLGFGLVIGMIESSPSG